MKCLMYLLTFGIFTKSFKDLFLSYMINFGKSAISLFWEIGKSYPALF